MKMKTILFCFLALTVSVYAQDDNPFASIGKKGKIITLSNGKYKEVHVYDSLQRIGSVVVNRNTGKIHQLLDIDTLYSESTLDPTVYSRWYSLDPRASKYAGMSPYVAFGNNPILFADDDGDTIRIAGRTDDFIAGLQLAFSNKIIAEMCNGRLMLYQSDNTTLSDYEREAFDNLLLVQNAPEYVDLNIVNNSEDVSTADYYTNTLDIGDISAFGNDENFMTSRSVITHEIIEQYEKSLLSDEAQESFSNGYIPSHGTALNFEKDVSNIDRASGKWTSKTTSFSTGEYNINVSAAWRKNNGVDEKIVIYTIYKNNNLFDQIIENMDFDTEKVMNVESKSGAPMPGYDSHQKYKEKE